jgi:hypothetical protein
MGGPATPAYPSSRSLALLISSYISISKLGRLGHLPGPIQITGSVAARPRLQEHIRHSRTSSIL